jgi:N-hydroxyarylamine O-acetyltransferase
MPSHWLDAYFTRVGYHGSREPTLDLLTKICGLHTAVIPFENLDPLLGRAVSIDLADIAAKLVYTRRGGYCFEHGGLLSAVLTGLGYEVCALAARVIWQVPEHTVLPMTHRMIKVDLAMGPVLVDVGFGGQTPTAPLRLETGIEQPTPYGTYRFIAADSGYELQLKTAGGWGGLYRFSLTPRLSADLEMANWYTATHPRSRFVRNLVASKTESDVRLSLLNHQLSMRRLDGTVERRVISSSRMLQETLTERFGISLPAPIEEIWSRTPSRDTL